MISGKRIALVGGGGFIGHHLALALASQGAKVSVIDSLRVNNLYSFSCDAGQDYPHQDLYMAMVNERIELLRRNEIRLHLLDARDYHDLSCVLGEIKPQVLVHLAAVSHANKSNKSPYTTFDHSLRTLENALDSVRDSIEHFVYFSSSMVYGNFNGQSVTEDMPCNPIGIYGALKYAAEKIVVAYNQVFGMPYTIVRPSALYGERCISRRVGQIFLENAVYGKDLYLDGDGSDSLDFTYIRDLCQGVSKIIETDASKGEIFNITYGSAQPILTMAELVQEHFPGIQLHFRKRDKLMPKRGTLSIDKAKSLIGYTPEYPLSEGYLEYIAWYKRFMASISEEKASPAMQKFVMPA